ncbi:MAG TPA: GDSL-type esterase/lipase family protein [Luteolibacter sp.]|nr:GDSL-type esterase/lipase family protein [Luteolibacter sp.]
MIAFISTRSILRPLIALGLFVMAATQVSQAEEKMPWQNPEYRKEIPATIALSRPEPTESGWTAWLRHHEDRSRWCTEKPVDLLMVGDSIVFGWDRTGRKVWDEFYGKRNAVNIGSSGDRTHHMLWHFQNGGLAGMKARNPKVVVMMIGTNNRGIPELHGADTAYGILALLKELHAQLPQSKIMLMPIFPRGKTPEDQGRLRNNEINAIIKDYADNKTVHWLDISHVFVDGAGNLKMDLMPDGLHPNEAGYRVWAEAMEPALKKLLGES